MYPAKNPAASDTRTPSTTPIPIPALAPPESPFAGSSGDELEVEFEVAVWFCTCAEYSDWALDLLLNFCGMYKALYSKPAGQQSVLSPQHHFSDVAVPSQGVSCTLSCAFSCIQLARSSSCRVPIATIKMGTYTRSTNIQTSFEVLLSTHDPVVMRPWR
jgi:hypothetical protein